MKLIPKLLVALAVVGLLAGPAVAAPSLFLHSATLTAPTAPAAGHGRLPLVPLAVPGVAMAIKIKDTGTIAAKFVSRAQTAGPDYATGVAGAGADWQNNAAAAEPNYEQGVQAGIARKAFGKGIQSAGSQKYTDNATKLGAQRYPTGVANAQAAYAKGVQPHLDMMKSLDLPPRGPKGSPQNQQRAQVVAAANRKLKVGS